jgi:hypothetical protein
MRSTCMMCDETFIGDPCTTSLTHVASGERVQAFVASIRHFSARQLEVPSAARSHLRCLSVLPADHIYYSQARAPNTLPTHLFRHLQQSPVNLSSMIVRIGPCCSAKRGANSSIFPRTPPPAHGVGRELRHRQCCQTQPRRPLVDTAGGSASSSATAADSWTLGTAAHSLPIAQPAAPPHASHRDSVTEHCCSRRAGRWRRLTAVTLDYPLSSSTCGSFLRFTAPGPQTQIRAPSRDLAHAPFLQH